MSGNQNNTEDLEQDFGMMERLLRQGKSLVMTRVGKSKITMTLSGEKNGIPRKGNAEFYDYDEAKTLIGKQMSSLEFSLENESQDDDHPNLILRWDRQSDGEFAYSVIGKIIHVEDKPTVDAMKEAFDKFKKWLVDHDEYYFPTPWPKDCRLYYDIANAPGLLFCYRDINAESDEVDESDNSLGKFKHGYVNEPKPKKRSELDE